MNLLKTTGQLFRAKYVREYLNAKRDDWQQTPASGLNPLRIAGLILFADLLLIQFAGLHAGFFIVHDAGLRFLPTLFWELASFCGNTMVALGIALLFSYRFPRITIAVASSALIGAACIHFLKRLFDQPRPSVIFGPDVLPIIGPVLNDGSMPSGHTATAFILATVLTRTVKQTWKQYLMLFAASVVGVSRIVCGVHWPTDVLAGAAIGLFTGWLGLALSDKLQINLRSYSLICLLLLISTLVLTQYDGGFQHTRPVAILLGITFIGYWCSSWLLELLSARKRERQG